MSYSYTQTETKSFTVTHAKHLAAKVATDLKRMQRFYNQPCDADIANYENEVIELLKNGYLGTITYGFKKDDKWIAPTIRYTAKELSEMTGNDDDPGRILPGSNISGASFYSYLTYSDSWNGLSYDAQDKFKKTLPFYRGGAAEPGINGYLSNDKTYSSGGRALERSTVKSY